MYHFQFWSVESDFLCGGMIIKSCCTDIVKPWLLICVCIASCYASLSNICLTNCILLTLSCNAIQLHPEHKSKMSLWDDWLYIILYWSLAWRPLHQLHLESWHHSGTIFFQLRPIDNTFDKIVILRRLTECYFILISCLQTSPSVSSGFPDVILSIFCQLRPIGNTFYFSVILRQLTVCHFVLISPWQTSWSAPSGYPDVILGVFSLNWDWLVALLLDCQSETIDFVSFPTDI